MTKLKLGNDVVAEFIRCLQVGIMEGQDISTMIREFEVTPGDDGAVHLTKDYLENNRGDGCYQFCTETEDPNAD